MFFSIVETKAPKLSQEMDSKGLLVVNCSAYVGTNGTLRWNMSSTRGALFSFQTGGRGVVQGWKPTFLQSITSQGIGRLSLHFVASELLCAISSFAGFQKSGVKVVSLHLAWFYFCILTAGFKAHRIPNSS